MIQPLFSPGSIGPVAYVEGGQNPHGLATKPQGPSTLHIIFACPGCGNLNEVTEEFADWYDTGDGDSLDFTCECGKYFKKTSRIDECWIQSSWYSKAKP